MKRTFFTAALMVVLMVALMPGESFALGVEAAVGMWRQSPSGDLGYKVVSDNDRLDLEDDLNYDTENRVFGRVKADLPLFLPNVYLVATPMEFEGDGSKTFNFQFGDTTFNVNFPFTSRVQLDHYDVALYYSLPFLKTATMGKLNAEIGINARIIDLEAEVSGRDLTGNTVTESESFTLAVPMIYAGVQISPIDLVALEVEGRGIAYNSNHYYDFIGRLKVKPFGPVFIAGGYRMEEIKIDHSDVEVSIKFAGPFLEAGVQF